MTEVHTVSQACHLDLAKVQHGCHAATERALGNVISTVGHATPRGPCHGKGKRSTFSHLIWCITARRTLPCLIRTHIIQSNYKVTTIHARMCEHFFSRLLHRCIFNSVCWCGCWWFQSHSQPAATTALTGTQFKWQLKRTCLHSRTNYNPVYSCLFLFLNPCHCDLNFDLVNFVKHFHKSVMKSCSM